MVFFIIGLAGLFLGFLIGFSFDFFENKLMIKKSRIEADNLIHEIREKTDISFENLKNTMEEKHKKISKQWEQDENKKKELIQKLQSFVDKNIYQLKLSSEKQKITKKAIEDEIKEIKKSSSKHIEEKKRQRFQFKKIQNELIKKLIEHFSIDVEEIKSKLKERIEESLIKKIQDDLDKKEVYLLENLKREAFFYIENSLNRFTFPSCTERGIPFVQFDSPAKMEKVLGKNKIHLKWIEQECGVDIVVNEENLFANILGIDPVRKELGRLTLKRLLTRMNTLSQKTIKDIVRKNKISLFAKIKYDGRQICQRLNLKNIHPKIQSTLGALRYRYSFAQNQHFHCEEVGWLCGILSSELNLPFEKGYRSGLFHDIGKAMDHSIEGSHAVIGANFIAQYGEGSDIVQAVKTHHHDEKPSSPLAFLVIVADAISGSRPEARRFTEDAYFKKVATLEKIIDSFEEIEDSYIMNAGRELRAIVNDKNNISDRQIIDLSKQIARKVEQECAYPGLIKVTVVKHSEVSSIAK